MARKESSLDRLSKLSNPDEDNLFNDLDDSISTDDYLDSMSDMAKSKFGTLIQEVSLDDESSTEQVIDEPIVEEPVEESKVDTAVNSIDESLLDDPVETIIEEPITEETVSSVSSTVEEPHNVTEKPTEQINIDVEDTGVDIPLENTNESLFNNKPKRTRGRRKNSESVKETLNKPADKSTMVNDISSMDLILSQLSKDIIDDLRKQHYRIGRFDDKSMEVIYSYMYKKF